MQTILEDVDITPRNAAYVASTPPATFSGITSENDLIQACETGGAYRLATDVTIMSTVSISQDITIDLYGNDIRAGDIEVGLVLENGCHVTIMDSKWEPPSIVYDKDGIPTNFTESTYFGTIFNPQNAVFTINQNSTLTLESGNIVSGGDAIVLYNGTLEVHNGAITSGQSAIYTRNYCTVDIYNGYFFSQDNAIIRTDASTNNAGMQMNITVYDGVFIGKTKSQGWLACGIYKQNISGALNVRGGYFYIHNGVGVVLCNANTDIAIEGGMFITTGLDTGRVVTGEALPGCVPVVLYYHHGSQITGGTFIAIGDSSLEQQPETAVMWTYAGDYTNISGGRFGPKVNHLYVDLAQAQVEQTQYQEIVY